MTKQNMDPRDLARRIRSHVLRMCHRAKASHVGSGLSVADILAVLYGQSLQYDPANADWADRDRLIISKGHAAAAVYAALAEVGFFSVDWLDRFCESGQPLGGHVTRHGVPGVEASTGSLGHGLGMACGLALFAKRRGLNWRTYAVLSDGECDEGSVWEAALFAPHHGLDNLFAIVDYNKIQSFGSVSDVLELEPLAQKWSAFNWRVHEINGHDTAQLSQVFNHIPPDEGKPTVIIAHTIKGKGVSFMEGKLEWHYKSPNDQELRRALEELEAGS